MSKRSKRRHSARPTSRPDAFKPEPSDGFGPLLALLCVTFAVPLLVVGMALKLAVH